MYILGDIGNSDTKIFLVNKKDKILKRTSLISKNINNKNLEKKIKFLIKDIKKVEKILFCSVVPKSFNLIKFRTMKRNTPSLASHLINQKYVTRFGRIIRLLKLDELLSKLIFMLSFIVILNKSISCGT